MRKVAVLPSLERSLKKLSPSQRKQLSESLQAFNVFLTIGELSPGLGFKKINHDKYELRVDIRLRVILKAEAEVFYLVLVGSHDDVKRYLRSE
jgi:mRNA-degrading endonuclease RelE of RelBE toxin-antitoxin system